MKNIWNSPAPTLGLAMTASCLFMWGRNWHMYTWAGLGASLAWVLGVGLLLMLLVGLLARACRTPHPRWLTMSQLYLLVGLLLVEILKTLLDIPAQELAASLGIMPRYFRIPLALAVFLAVCLARGFRLLNTILLAWLLIALGNGLVNIWSAPEGKIAEAGFKVTLKKTPDIFLYFLESYHSPYAMRLLYGHDAGPMVEYLRGKNFLIYDQTLSNSPASLMSMVDMFTMRPSFNLARGNSDILQAGRRVIGGSDDNHLFKMLKNNGYYTTFLTMGSDYYFQSRGPNLDATDDDVRSLFDLKPLYDLIPGQLRLLTAIYLKPSPQKLHGALPDRVRQIVERGPKQGSPFLACFKGGAGHVPASYRGTQEEIEAWKPVYLDKVAEADAEIKKIVEYLDEAAPEAIVILVGDHGAWGYRGVLGDHDTRLHWGSVLGRHDLEEVGRKITEWNVTLDTVVQDVFGTLLAIRLPGGEQRDISYGLALNHVNLFRHVFAYLNDDPDLLSTREEPPLSRLGNLILGRDNHPVLERSD